MISGELEILKRKGLFSVNNPPNTRLDEDVFRLRLQKTSSRRLQDILIKTNIFALVTRLKDVLVKTSSKCLEDIEDIFKAFCQDIFKMSSKRLQDILQKTSSRHLAKNVFKTSSRRLQYVFKTSCKDIFKTFSSLMIRIKPFSFFETSSTRL